MVDLFYQLLSKMGYTHPAHPPLTHITIGLVVGAFLFCIGGWFSRSQNLILTARHCLILALLAWFPTVLFGYLDWQHYYAGAMIFPIKMKLILAGALLVFLFVAVTGRPTETGARRVRVFSFLCMLLVMGIGYLGGELVYKGKGSQTSMTSAEGFDVQAAADQFTRSCGTCHPNGGNAFKPRLPLRKAPQLSDFNTFLSYIRSPKARDGSVTIMPPITAEALSDEQARHVYQYITRVIMNE